MAIMKPDEIRNDAYESEQIIFNNLKSSPHPRARYWRVFHSIYVENPNNPVKPREMDFLIFIDDYCAVIYLEAKGGRYSINGIGKWCTPYGQLVSPSPPYQASSGMYALKKQYNAYLDSKSLIAVGCVVAFTDWDTYPTQRPMELPELIMRQDARDPTKLCKRLDDYAKQLPRKNLDDGNYLDTLEALYDLQSELQKRYMPLEDPVDPVKITRSDLENLRQHLLRLTEEQITNLNNVELNERCVIKGAAGTGKTVLAMELARRRCEEGETVALMCSNPNLASRFKRWAKTLPSDTGGRVITGTPATLPIEALSGNQKLQNGHRQRLANSRQLEESLKRGELNEAWEKFIKETIKDLRQGNVSFDYLIVDEAQNLCEEAFLELQDALLKGGLAKGRWAMFGDFDHQNLVTGRAIDGDGTGALKSKIPYWTKGKLETNCRNTGEIAEAVARLVRIESPPRPGVYGPEFERKYFNSQEELEDMLDTLIYDWKNRDFQSSDIICCLAALARSSIPIANMATGA